MEQKPAITLMSTHLNGEHLIAEWTFYIFTSALKWRKLVHKQFSIQALEFDIFICPINQGYPSWQRLDFFIKMESICVAGTVFIFYLCRKLITIHLQRGIVRSIHCINFDGPGVSAVQTVNLPFKIIVT